MEGLGTGVSNMKSGERALLHVGWELGYGEEGSFSFPNVPPMADIIYEVELIGFDETKEVCHLMTSLNMFLFSYELLFPILICEIHFVNLNICIMDIGQTT